MVATASKPPEGFLPAAASGFWAGLLAGAATGIIDCLWSWGEASQFLGFADKLRFTAYLACSYALLASLSGAILGLSFRYLWNYTVLGKLCRFAYAQHRQQQHNAPEAAVAGLALVLTTVPALCLSIGLTYMESLSFLSSRKHMGLTIALAMLLVLVAIGGGLLIGVALSPAVERGLAKWARRGPKSARALSAFEAVPLAAGALALVATTVAITLSWNTLQLLRLRPYAVGLMLLLLFLPSFPQGQAMQRRLHTKSKGIRFSIYGASPLMLLVVLLVFGESTAIQKATNLYSGLGESISKGLRTMADWDRDGHSRILGGGDCDDWDSAVYPGRVDVPDDGVDNNCLGGDATLQQQARRPSFVEVPEANKRNNVILITVDTLRSDHLGSYGYTRPTSPNIDRLAERGTLFRNAWAHAPSTRYSIPSILTGRYPLNVSYDEIPNQWPGLSLENQTIAEVAKSQELTTGAILNYWYFDTHRNMNQGFDHYDNANKRLHRSAGKEGPKKTLGSSSKSQTDKAIKFVDERREEQFFLWVHYYDPHYEYEKHATSPDFGDGPIDRYDNEIHHTDSHIGRLLQHLRKTGLDTKTSIVLTGDHGEGFGEHNIDFHGYELYAAQTRVPLIIHVPGAAGRRIDTPAGHVDILPTIANLLGAKESSSMMGRSLVPYVLNQGEQPDDRWLFQQLSFENQNEHRGAVSKNCHILYHVSPNTSWELYRADTDPNETRDIIDSPGKCKSAKETLGKWLDTAELPRGAAEALLPSRPRADKPFTADFGKELRLLGVDVPARVSRGQRFELVYYWEALGTPDEGWKIFAHFSGSGSLFQGDHKPVRPFSWWKKGQFIRTHHTVTVPRTAKPGRYSLWTGVFRGKERKPARSGDVEVAPDHKVLATTVEVVR